MTDLRYPIGRPSLETAPPTPEERQTMIEEIAALPANLRAAAAGLTDEQLDTPYRPDGWTVRQVVHHVADSHINSYVRFKWALTEDDPTIKAYDEGAWALLADSKLTPIDVSLDLVDSLHRRWVVLLKAMTEEEFARSFRHPKLGLVSLNMAVLIYAWHGRHHVAHITSLRERMGWK